MLNEQIWSHVSSGEAVARIEPQHCSSFKKVMKHLITSIIGENAKSVVKKQWTLSKLKEWKETLPVHARPVRLLVFVEELQSSTSEVIQRLFEVC